MIHVSAGVIVNDQGKILACRRAKDHSHAHMWEFPGGKQEANETAEECLQRELIEELELQIRDIHVIRIVNTEGIYFTFFSAVACSTAFAKEHEEIRYVTPRKLLELQFCPADEPVARALALSNPPVTALFWDYDGTVMDTYPSMSTDLMNTCQQFGIKLDFSEAYILLKHSLDNAIQYLSKNHHIPQMELLNAYQHMHQNCFHLPQLMSGVREALACNVFPPVKHFLVTHNNRSVKTTLQECGLLECFADCITSEDGFPRKPAPDVLIELMHRHGILPQSAMMVGDRPIDVQAGKAAGMLTCLLDTDNLFPEQFCDIRLIKSSMLSDVLMSRIQL